MTWSKIGRAAFSGAMGLALTFGGWAAATPAQASQAKAQAACSYDYQCQNYCRWWYGTGYYGYCVVGQCYCRYVG